MSTPQTRRQHSFILGCWQLDDRSWTSLPLDEVERVIDTYLAWGVNTFDTADIYGRSEKLLGQFLKGRADTKIFTKMVFFREIPTAQQIQYKLDNSLRNLQRDYLDNVQVHWHSPSLDFAPLWDTLRTLHDRGKIRQLGVTNFTTPMLKQALAYAPISTHQVQYSLIDRRVENTMQALCLERGITLLPYGAIAGGFLSDKFVNVPHLSQEFDHARSFYYNTMIDHHGGWSGVHQLLQVMAKIGKSYDLSVAQVALNWLHHQPGVGQIITGLTTHRPQIQQNMEALDRDISAADLQTLADTSTALIPQQGDIYSYERG
ncbi:aldo/keto reductase [Spirulina major CS-329]|uniref:aldo/keto reductase n=1 Tax=Spirulina TaxID=1154 RepID=UPI00232CB6A2|nr:MULTISPECIES: aldo/keto reductase [Spirulina]MDB9494802.1 aldo/keto reductase [Spirulina subsalsa CS-330]MDB9501638.1 aldo/keto reductase [Spirulina major CS-329]